MPNNRTHEHADNFKSWAAKQSPETLARINNQAAIDVAHWQGKEPTTRQLMKQTE